MFLSWFSGSSYAANPFTLPYLGLCRLWSHCFLFLWVLVSCANCRVTPCLLRTAINRKWRESPCCRMKTMKFRLLDNNCACAHCRHYIRHFSIPGTPECMCTTYSWQRIFRLRFWQTCCLLNHNNALSQDDMSGLRGGYSRGIGNRCDPRSIHLSPTPSLGNSSQWFYNQSEPWLDGILPDHAVLIELRHKLFL